MKTIAIRVDGGLSVGMGHVMRCLSLAKEIKKLGHKVYFISKYNRGIERIEENGYEVLKLIEEKKHSTNNFDYGDAKDLHTEIEEINTLKYKKNIDLIIVDSYNVTIDFFRAIKKDVKLAYIDDINKFTYPVDVVINGNLTGIYEKYEKYNSSQKLLLGTKYNLIRDEFRDLVIKDRCEEVKEIMITTGGADPFFISQKIINTLINSKRIDMSKIRLNVVVANGFENKEELRKLSKKHKNVHIYENVEKMSKIMIQSDVAISAGGSTLYELCACHVTTISFIYADNQEMLVKKMHELGYVLNIGWYDKVEENIESALIKIISDAELRQSFMTKQVDLIDARGSIRVAQELLNMLN